MKCIFDVLPRSWSFGQPHLQPREGIKLSSTTNCSMLSVISDLIYSTLPKTLTNYTCSSTILWSLEWGGGARNPSMKGGWGGVGWGVHNMMPQGIRKWQKVLCFPELPGGCYSSALPKCRAICKIHNLSLWAKDKYPIMLWDAASVKSAQLVYIVTGSYLDTSILVFYFSDSSTDLSRTGCIYMRHCNA